MTGPGGQQPGAGQQLGNALRELQRRSGRTLRSLESEVMISDSSLSRYLRGSTVPPWATVRDLCRALGADPAEYRALWEAADRCQPKPPADPAGPAPAADTRWRRWRRTAGSWARHRWAWAVGGACAGLVCGGVLAPFVPWPPGSAPARGAAAPQESGSAHGAGAGRGGAGLADHNRIFVNRVTGNCLDHSLDKGLRSFAPNGLSYQRWTVHPYPDGSSELRNHATGACLDDGASGLRGASCSRAASQKWTVTALADASVEVRSRASGTCLDDGEQGLRTVPCDGSDGQKWG
ncbi:RICIN domain-containing protein [Streptomyces sp. NPDC059851]|uniref:RICIN domain-containing protein n=1 Tax=Streptomyces sp. NPDC059851 TaxID=3346971 RepID=UPI00365BF2EC